MSMRIVIALGGNALGKSPKEQLDKVKNAAKSLVDLIEQGHEILVVHGNGPQVGMINLAFEYASKANSKVSQFDLPECTAMSQGYIGFHLQNAIDEELRIRKLPYKAATVISQVEVDSKDSAFENPTKPIGLFYEKEEAEKLMALDSELVMVEDAGRGYRRVVPSPKPKAIVEKDVILNMIKNEFVVITCGGGGVPVVLDENGSYKGICSVIDKDFASAKLAEVVDADYLIILTAVDRVSINFNKENQKELEAVSIEALDQYIVEGQFAPGSMLPKVEAAKKFVSTKPGRKAIIASLEKAHLAISGESGTLIHQ